MEFNKTGQRDDSFFVGGDGIPSRISDSGSGKTYVIDGFTSPDGIPIGIERGSSLEEKREGLFTRGLNMLKFIKSYPISTSYTVVLFVVGALWQGWISF